MLPNVLPMFSLFLLCQLRLYVQEAELASTTLAWENAQASTREAVAAKDMLSAELESAREELAERSAVNEALVRR